MIESIINWILGHLPAVIFVVIVIAQMIRAANRARQAHDEQKRQAADPAADHRHEEQAREEIRRRIAERRAGGATPAPAPAEPPPLAEARPAPSSETTQLPDVFDGPLGRMLQELQKRAAPPPAPEPTVVHARNTAEVERQEQLAEQMRALAEARAATQRRAAHVAEERAAMALAEPALRTAARDHLLQDLASPQSLRRALVLREVLGAPVALR